MIRQYWKSQILVLLSDENVTVVLIILGNGGPPDSLQTSASVARERPPVSPVFCVPPHSSN